METRDKTVNERNYVLLLPAVREAMPLCSRVAVLLGPILTTLGSESGDKGMEKFAVALRGIDPIKLDALLMQAVLISKLTCESNSICSIIDFERHFSQYRNDTYQVIIWALWECVRDFFPQAGTFIQKVKIELQKVSVSPKDGQTNSG